MRIKKLLQHACAEIMLIISVRSCELLTFRMAYPGMVHNHIFKYTSNKLHYFYNRKHQTQRAYVSLVRNFYSSCNPPVNAGVPF